MGENTLSVKITADVIDLQTKFVTAKAEVSALTKEMNDLAKQSAQGILDPAGLAQLQDVSRQFLEAKQAAAELSQELKGTHEAGVNLGEGLAEIRGQISNAFELTGIAAAYEGILKVGEVIEQLGERATQIHAMSDVLGVTTDQFQAMSLAAAEGGTSVEVLARASERLIALLAEARSGSGAAEQKLFDLGATLEQIKDPTFQINDLLGVLHDRLLNTATSQDTMNVLIKDFGPRAALAAEAIKAYDGSLGGVAASGARVSALTTEHIQKAHEEAVAWDELKTRIENLSTKALISAAAMSDWLREHNATLRALGSAVGAEGKPEEKPNVGTIDRSSQQVAQQAAQAQMALDREMAQQEMENVKAGTEAFKQGSAERLAAVQEYAKLAAKYYGNDEIDKVKSAKTAEIAEERAYQEAQASLRAEEVRATIKSDDDTVKARLAGIKLSIDANDRYLNDAIQTHNAIKSMEQTGLELQTHIYQQRATLSAQSNAIAAKATREQLAQWQFLTNGMRAGFTSAIQGILSGTENFGQAMRGIFTSVLDGIISKLAEWAAEWVTKLIITQAANQATAATSIAANSGVAAVAAMASVAAIPFYGWAMAPEVGAATYAEGMAYEASASQGYDVPRGLSPITQLHPEEMVLPAPIANTVRNAMENGGSGAGSGSRTVHIHGKAGSTFTQDQLVAMLRNLGHQFKLG